MNMDRKKGKDDSFMPSSFIISVLDADSQCKNDPVVAFDLL